MIILGIVIGIVICLCIYFICIHPKLIQRLNDNTQLKNEEVNLLNSIQKLTNEKDSLSNQNAELKYENSSLLFQKEETINNIKIIQDNIEASNKRLFDSGYALMQEQLDTCAEQERIRYEEACAEYKTIYLQLTQELSVNLNSVVQEYQDKLANLANEVTQYEQKIQGLVEYFKLQDYKTYELSKYTIILDEEDVAEIIKLRDLMPLLRNSRPVAKVIWESYYRSRCNEMISRIGADKKTGIYKITNLVNQKSYVGQAVDIGERIKEHCKAGVGIDTPNSQLYKAMLSIGPEHFSFEILEECPREQLNASEAYWIKLFDTQTFGYNMTKGNK